MLLCQGDSGGPLTQDGILIGVVSGGDVTGFECDTSVSIQDCYTLLLIRLSKILKKIYLSLQKKKKTWGGFKPLVYKFGVRSK